MRGTVKGIIIGVVLTVVAFIAIGAAMASQASKPTDQISEDRLDRIAKLEFNNTMAKQKYLEAMNEDNLTKKIELMQEANMYENGTWAETCRLYPELNC